MQMIQNQKHKHQSKHDTKSRLWCKRQRFFNHQVCRKQRIDPKHKSCKQRKGMQTKKRCIDQQIQHKFSKPAGGALSGTPQWRDKQAGREQLTDHHHFQIPAGPFDLASKCDCFYVIDDKPFKSDDGQSADLCLPVSRH